MLQSGIRYVGVLSMLLALGCTAEEEIDTDETALRSESSGELIYAGEYWQDLGETSFCEEANELATANGVHALEFDIEVSCGQAAFNHSLSFGHYGWLPSAEGVGLTPLVIASRDGTVGVPMDLWDAYQGLDAEAPEYMGTMANNELALSEHPPLSIGGAELDVDIGVLASEGACWRGTVNATSDYTDDDGTVYPDCEFSGTMTLAPVDAVAGSGTLFIIPIAD